MPKVSAGLLMYRRTDGDVEVLLVHPGGPFWAKKDEGAWFLPKGELNPGEDALEGAKREFEEETGLRPSADFVSLGDLKHRSGKLVIAFTFEGNCDPSEIRSNSFEIEWPPKSGERRQFPEVDRAAFFTLPNAMKKILPAEAEFLFRLEDKIGLKSSRGDVQERNVTGPEGVSEQTTLF